MTASDHMDEARGDFVHSAVDTAVLRLLAMTDADRAAVARNRRPKRAACWPDRHRPVQHRRLHPLFWHRHLSWRSLPVVRWLRIAGNPDRCIRPF